MILHIGDADKFTTSLWRFLSPQVDLSDHRFLVKQRLTEFDETLPDGFTPPSGLVWMMQFIILGFRAEKIILHGLFEPATTVLLLLQPWLLGKCYWVMWGGDVYFMESRRPRLRTRIHDWMRRRVIPRIGNLLTYIDDDMAYLRAEYGASGKRHQCVMYPSNTFRREPVDSGEIPGGSTRILAGNSASETNNHALLFEAVLPFRDADIEILCPLSYGDAGMREAIAERGHALFGDRFAPLTGFMPIEEYRALLASVSIAIFAHTRQEAMGTTLELLGQGKKVFVVPDTPQWNLLTGLGIRVFDVHNFDISPLEPGDSEENSRIVAARFSPDLLLQQWIAIFDD